MRDLVVHTQRKPDGSWEAWITVNGVSILATEVRETTEPRATQSAVDIFLADLRHELVNNLERHE